MKVVNSSEVTLKYGMTVLIHNLPFISTYLCIHRHTKIKYIQIISIDQVPYLQHVFPIPLTKEYGYTVLRTPAIEDRYGDREANVNTVMQKA